MTIAIMIAAFGAGVFVGYRYRATWGNVDKTIDKVKDKL